MVEVYFNAQSNNGTLTDGEFIPGVLDQGSWNDASFLWSGLASTLHSFLDGDPLPKPLLTGLRLGKLFVTSGKSRLISMRNGIKAWNCGAPSA